MLNIINLSNKNVGKTIPIKCFLICFHWVGGNGNAYRSLAKDLEPFGINVIAVSLPGRNSSRGQPSPHILTSINVVVDSIYDALLARYIEWNLQDLPVIYFGHSLGGIICYELIRKSQNETNPDRKLTINHAIISAVKSPLELTSLNNYPSYRFHHKKSNEELFEYIKSIGGLPDGIDPEFLRNALPTMKADYQVFETYNYFSFDVNNNNSQMEMENESIQKIDCALSLFLGSDDVSVSVESMEQWYNYTNASPLKNGEMDIELFPHGSHFYLTEAHVKNDFAMKICQICQHVIGHNN
eukprot:gene4063-5807_t